MATGWTFGVDFSDKSPRVIAVRVGAGEIKYGLDWIGPLNWNETTAELLEQWARRVLNIHGGYVHLFPADGDATDELKFATEE